MILNNKYRLIEKIGKGTYGEVFKGENIRTKEQVAIKVEKQNNETNSLKYETQIYQALGQGNIGIPQVKWFGIVDSLYFMVLPLLGESLTSFKRTHSHFSLKVVLCFAIDMIQRLQILHRKGFIHRDVKPDNFLMGLDEDKDKHRNVTDLYLVDYGFCRKFITRDGKHIPICNNKQLIGTPNYISLHVHNGVEPSRRDDLESVGYIMIYLLFPDTHEYCKPKSMVELVQFKINICEKKIPDIIIRYLNYCKNLSFEQKPDYDIILTMLRNTLAAAITKSI